MARFHSALVAAALAVALPSALAAQDAPRPLTHDDYGSWRRIGGRSLTRDGNWLAYTLSEARGDSQLIVRQTNGDTVHRIPKGSNPSWSSDGRFVLFQYVPGFDEKRVYEFEQMLRKEQKSKKKDGKKDGKKDELKKPESRYALLEVANGEITELEDVQSARMASEGLPMLFLHLETPKKEKKDEGKDDAKEKESGEKSEGEEKSGEKPEEKKGEKKDKPKPEKWWSDGRPLVLHDLRDRTETRIEGVVSFGHVSGVDTLYYVRNSKEQEPGFARGLFARKMDTGAEMTIVEGGARFSGFRTDSEDTRMVFFTNRNDREAEEPKSELFVWDFEPTPARKLISHGMRDFPDGHELNTGSVTFSEDGAALLFGIDAPKPEDLPAVLSDEKVTVDLWHWQDPLMQPMQERQARSLASRTQRWVCHIDDGKIVQASQSPQERVRFLTKDGSRLLITDGSPYAKEISWDARYSDYYVANAFDGSREKVFEHMGGRVSASPSGRYMMHWNGEHWFCTDLVDGVTNNLTAGIDVPFWRWTDDRPQPRGAYGVAGWTEGEERVVLYDEFDIWKVAPDGSKPVCVTDGLGRMKSVEFRYIETRDRREVDTTYLPADSKMLLSATDLNTMASGFWTDRLDGLGRPEMLVMDDCRFGRPTKAAEADVFLLTKERFDLYPDLHVTDSSFESMRQVSDANPQVKEFSWGTSELVTWVNSNGVELKGILRKPDNFDPSKKYPMIVYFYEKRSRGLHGFNTPGPSQNPQPSYYVSNGYLFFEPDIVYIDGYPGESAVECIIPGVQSLIAKGFVKEDSIGAAGHSWGGYQTAYLATRTNLFAALESGAPVSNMTSAYGGIRWASGMSRAFQYEKTQSRIGGTLWEKPMHYLENSPLFRADDVETPVLMVHNDNDGAVPWYQGIEFFSALRRLNKEVYMFNYNGSGHGLRRWANRLDFCKRTSDFFDHHLRGAEKPAWMASPVLYPERTRKTLEFITPWSMKERERRKAEKATKVTETISTEEPAGTGSQR